MSEKIIKSVQTEILDTDDSKGIIKGYANVYNVEDSHKDISLPGSFVKTVSEQKAWIRINKNHDRNVLIGAPLELDANDPYGLHLVAKLNLETTAGKDAYTEAKFLIENGLKAGFSIGGYIMKRDEKNSKMVKEYRLSEISLLTVEPSNTLSFVEVFKSMQEDTKSVQDFFTFVEKAYNEQGFSDPYKQSLENILKSLDKQPSELIETTAKSQPTEQEILIKYYSQFITK